MPAKKKAPKMSLGGWATMELDLAYLEKELKTAQADSADLRLKLIAEEREVDFWIDEAERFRNQVVELLRERAAAQANRGVGT